MTTLEQHPDHKQDSRVVAVVAIALFVACVGYNLLRYDLTDTAHFGGDEWYFQSIAVNLQDGDGYRLGGRHDFSDYKFVRDTPYETWMDGDALYEHYYATNEYNFYSSPGYVLFLAAVYKLVGVRPIVVKYLHVLLIALVAAMIPVMSSHTWPRWGVVTGAFASVAFIFLFAPNPNLIMGEPLILFLLAVWGMIMTWIEGRVATARVLALGACTGVLLLVKSYVLLLVFAVVFIIRGHRIKWRGSAMACAYVAVVAAIILPWSVYATRHSDRVVVVSTQLDNILLDGNNEDSIRNGGFCPGWRKWNQGDLAYLYNRIGDGDKSALEKVGLFYRENWARLPEMFARKIVAGTGRSPVVVLSLALFVLFYIITLAPRHRLHLAVSGDVERVPVFPLMCAIVWMTNTLVAFGLLRYTLIFLPFMAITAAHAPIAVWAAVSRRKS